MIEYAITDRRLMGDSAEEWVASALRVAGRADYLLLRERDMTASQVEALATAILTGLSSRSVSRPKLLVHGRPDIALAAKAAGVHLAADSGLTPRQVCEIYARAGVQPPVVSASVHTPDGAAKAANAGATLVLFAPVFGKVVAGETVSPATGLAALAEAVAAAAPVPVLALGGVTRANATRCLDAGAAGVAAIRMYFSGMIRTTRCCVTGPRIVQRT